MNDRTCWFAVRLLLLVGIDVLLVLMVWLSTMVVSRRTTFFVCDLGGSTEYMVYPVEK